MSNLSVNNKTLALNTVFLYLRSLFLLGITLYTSRVTLQILGVNDYGIYNVVGGIVAMFSMLSSTLASASQRFITFALGKKDFDNLKRVFSTCVTLHIALGLIIVILLEIFGVWFLNSSMNIPPDRLYAAKWVLQLSIATFFVGVISIPYNAVIIAHEKMSAFAYIGILEGLLKLGCVFLLLFLSWDKLIVYSILYFLITLLLRLIYSSYSGKHFEETKKISLRVNKALFKEMFAFAGWNLFGNGSLVLRNQGVDIVLNIFFGVVVNAAKGVSNQIQNAVQTLAGNFTTALKPQLTKAIAKEDYNRVYVLINNGSRYVFFMMMFLAVPVIITAPKLLNFWLSEVPNYSVQFVRWTMVYLMLDSLSRLMIHGILSHGKIKEYQIVVGGTKLLAIPFVFIALKMGANPMAGVWVNILLEAICLYERIIYNKKLINLDSIRFLKEVLFRCSIVLAVSFVLPIITLYYLTTNLVIEVIITLISITISVWILGINAEEKKIVLSVVKKYIHYNK